MTFFASLALITALSPAQVLFHEDFNDNSAGWTLGPQWAIGAATLSTCGPGGDNEDPGSDADGKAGGGVAGIVIGGCTGLAVHGYYYLTSPVIDTTGSTQLRLEFDRWLNSDYLPYMHNVIDVWNGSAWITIWQTVDSSVFYLDAAWTHQSFNITAHSNPRLRVRFGYSIGDPGVFNVSSWNLDNVRITNGEYFFDRFNNNAAGWTLDPEWAIGNATAGGAGGAGSGVCADVGDPGSDADGTAAGGVAGVVLGGDASTAANHGLYWLTSPVINTTGSNLLVLNFRRWLNSDYPPYMDSQVQVWNGSAWVTKFSVGAVGPTCIGDSAWQDISYDITAESNAALQVRFGFSILNSGLVYSMSSWNVDNVSIHDPSGACTLQFSAYNGPGSFRLSAHCLSATVPPGTTLFNCITLAPGAFPAGWFFGLDPSLTGDVIAQWNTAALPFVGTSNGAGDVVWDLPGGVPAGITIYAVTVAISPAGYAIGNSPPVTFTTL